MKSSLLVSVLAGAGFLGTALLAERSGALEPGQPELVAIINGDSNGDWDIDLSDGVYLLNFLYGGGPAPVPVDCGTGLISSENGDSNGDGSKDVSDVIVLLGWL